MELNNGDQSPPKPHVLLIPFPVLGRTNPMLQFAKRLSSKGLKVTVATTAAFSGAASAAISVATLPGFEETPTISGVDSYIDKFDKAAPESLAALIREQAAPVRCLVYDSSLMWALELARELGIYGAAFFPQSCAASLISCHVYNGVLAAPPVAVEGKGIVVPGLPEMEIGDLPSIVQEVGKYPLLEKLALRQFENFHMADWQFFNTFNVLENQVLAWMLSKWPTVTPIGPTIPSLYLDKRLSDDKEYGLSPFTPDFKTCIEWLDTKEDCSTIYVSFGSLADLEEEQMKEIAWGLKNSNKPFLWVVRASEEDKLPPDFKQLVSEQGKIVNWSPQLAVLAHRAVACFFTHCGWNSTMEAIGSGVPVVAMPQFFDQPTNAKFLVDVWKVGVRVKADDKGAVRRNEIECCVREVMEGENAEKMRRNAGKLRIEAIAAMDEGGSSNRGIDKFVAKINGAFDNI